MWMGIREMEYGTEVEVFKKDDMDRKKGKEEKVEVGESARKELTERSGRASERRARKQEPLRGALGPMRLARRQQINIRFSCLCLPLLEYHIHTDTAISQLIIKTIFSAQHTPYSV
jgi:hypothetical protein